MTPIDSKFRNEQFMKLCNMSKDCDLIVEECDVILNNWNNYTHEDVHNKMKDIMHNSETLIDELRNEVEALEKKIRGERK